MQTNQLKKLFHEFGGKVRFEHDLKKKNWFNIGGKSKVFYKAENLKELVIFLKKLNGKEKIFILGAGSNTLITDNFFDDFPARMADGRFITDYSPNCDNNMKHKKEMSGWEYRQYLTNNAETIIKEINSILSI